MGIAVVGMIAAAASAHGAVGAPKHFTHTDDIRAAPIKK